jgi:hypothetical protein
LLEKSRTRMVSIWGMKPGLKQGKLFVAPRTAGVVGRDRLLAAGSQPKTWDMFETTDAAGMSTQTTEEMNTIAKSAAKATTDAAKLETDMNS